MLEKKVQRFRENSGPAAKYFLSVIIIKDGRYIYNFKFENINGMYQFIFELVLLIGRKKYGKNEIQGKKERFSIPNNDFFKHFQNYWFNDRIFYLKFTDKLSRINTID